MFKSDTRRASPREEYNVFLDSEWRNITSCSQKSLFGEFGKKKNCQMSLLDWSSLLEHKNWQKRLFSCYLILRVLVKFVKSFLFWLKSKKKNVDCLWRMRAHHVELLEQSVLVCKAWRLLGLRMAETDCRYGGQLRMNWEKSLEQPKRSSPPDWVWGRF